MDRKKFAKIIVPEFTFPDGSMNVFSGFDRECPPVDGCEIPKWLWVMGIFDISGNYFKIEIDTRKSKLKKTVTFILDGKAYYHPINAFYTLGVKINPLNGHSISCSCVQCKSMGTESQIVQ